MIDVVLASLILGPAAITYLLRSNAALSFLALCAGFVLSISVIGDLKQLLSDINLTVTQSTLGLILLLVPLVITLLLSRGSKRGGLTFWLQLVVALCAGGFLVLSIAPILASSSEFDLSKSNFYDQLEKFQSLIIGTGAALSLALVWLTGVHKPKKH
jgi:hypothetical protein